MNVRAFTLPRSASMHAAHTHVTHVRCPAAHSFMPDVPVSRMYAAPQRIHACRPCPCHACRSCRSLCEIIHVIVAPSMLLARATHVSPAQCPHPSHSSAHTWHYGEDPAWIKGPIRAGHHGLSFSALPATQALRMHAWEPAEAAPIVWSPAVRDVAAVSVATSF